MTMLVLKRLARTAEMLLHSAPTTAATTMAMTTRTKPGRSRRPPAVTTATAAVAPITNWPSAPIVNSLAR